MAESEIDQLRRELKEYGDLAIEANDAAFALAGIMSRILVDAGAIDREELASAIAHRAGDPASADHNRLLLAFSRAVRMNFAGGRFDIIDGGRDRSVDPGDD